MSVNNTTPFSYITINPFRGRDSIGAAIKSNETEKNDGWMNWFTKRRGNMQVRGIRLQCIIAGAFVEDWLE